MTETEPAAPGLEEGPRPFSRFIAMLGEGEAHTQLSDDLHRLGEALREQAVARHRSVKGALTLKLSLVADEQGVVSVDYDITRKEPQPTRPRSIFWLTKGGNLTEINPRQQSLPLRDVKDVRVAPRDVEAGRATTKEA